MGDFATAKTRGESVCERPGFDEAKVTGYWDSDSLVEGSDSLRYPQHGSLYIQRANTTTAVDAPGLWFAPDVSTVSRSYPTSVRSVMDCGFASKAPRDRSS